ncbi:hypothetical protein [Stenotrophomonas humi]
MNKLVAIVTPVLLIAGASTAHAQSISSAWTTYRAQQQGQQVPQAQPVSMVVSDDTSQTVAATAYAPVPAQPVQRQQIERPRGGFFVGAQAGAGWVFEDVDQRVLSLNAGYRWQAGDFAQVGIEVAASRLEDTAGRDYEIPSLNFASVGANARFNFGHDSAWFGIVRSGYWYAESDDWFGEGGYIDGGYVGAGIGVDINRHFNLQLMYTAYLYSNPYYYYDDGDRVNRADVLTLGGEVRF